MGSTKGGLPYPEGTEPVAGGDDGIKALANAVDTGWLTPTFAGTWVPLTAYPTRYRVVAGMCYVTGSAYNNSGAAALSTVLTLPAAVMPVTDDTNPYQAGSMVSITPNGSTWSATYGYLDLRATGSVILHTVSPGAGLAICRFDGVCWRVRGMA